MSNPALPQPVPAGAPAKPFLDELFGGFWPERSVPAAPVTLTVRRAIASGPPRLAIREGDTANRYARRSVAWRT